ncbi:MAG: hypothetical protein ACR2J1_04195 [Methyloceanibacter sp.]|uniref:hypothetical protein n=1 Tax=Methyloceanibacter sp. TaxID=1965321 RepID=UPI003D9B08C5
MKAPSVSAGSLALGAFALGAFAVGALAIGALAIGALAIGRLTIRRGDAEKVYLGTVEIDDLTVRRLRVMESSAPENEAVKGA